MSGVSIDLHYIAVLFSKPQQLINYKSSWSSYGLGVEGQDRTRYPTNGYTILFLKLHYYLKDRRLLVPQRCLQ